MSRLPILFLFLSMACGPTPTDNGGGGGGGGNVDASPWAIDSGGGSPIDEFADAAPQKTCDKMDILFVIDNSGSMSEEQGNLGQNFPGFIDVLDTFLTDDGTPINYRVAVTSTGRDVTYTIEPPFPGFPPISQEEKGENGEMQQKCGMSKRWLDKGDQNLKADFVCAANLGTSGPGFEMPLYTTQLALKERVADGTNAGFMRDEALLAIVILTDEDDCSREDNNFQIGFSEDVCDNSNLEPIEKYHNFLDDLTGAPGRWAVAVIAGPGPGACSSEFGEATEATRLRNFVNMSGATGVFSSICAGDLSSALNDALETFDTACDNIPPIL